MPRPYTKPFSSRTGFEALEDRLALTAQALLDVQLQEIAAQVALVPQDQAIVPHDQPLEQHATDGHGWTDVATVREQFGLTGRGQTVVVIDSGIAYDHVALGGGFGSGTRVVGGWDFAENDANPFDDGPAGFHGTHVAGIIGAQDRRYPGVAPNVDLVALRVFDDQGGGTFSYVEKALQWVHSHKNDFRNPITTVNLSLGANWNSNSVPEWTTIEDELRTLEQDGVFIAVSAGNSFAKFNAPGLSYPAASQYVVPVASVGASGNLSGFSQRNDRVLAAPGERIMSTVPDYYLGSDGVKNDFSAASGTSMAAPYVAGSSVLVREALGALGRVGIDQDAIYDILRSTSDIVYDAVTGANYRRVNLQRAIEGIIGADEAGNSAATAKVLGALSQSLVVSGTIGRVSDQDFFQFTASSSGTVTITSQVTGELATKWVTTGGTIGNQNQWILNVTAGQTYSFGLGTSDGIGKYSLNVQLVAAPSGPTTPPNPATPNPPANPGTPTTPTPPPSNPTNPPVSPNPGNPNPPVSSVPTNWGNVSFAKVNDVRLLSPDTWYQMTATRSGLLTVESFFNSSAGDVNLEVYNSQRQLLGTSSSFANMERVDVSATAGSIYFVRARGINSDVDFRLTNLVAVNGRSVDVTGTASADVFTWTAGAQQRLTVNGVAYTVQGDSQVAFHGGSGNDTLTMNGGTGRETFTLRPTTAELVGANYSVTADALEGIQAYGDANDLVKLYDSAGSDTLTAGPKASQLTGAGYSNYAQGFGMVAAYATGGIDTARLSDSAGDDRFDGGPGSSLLRGTGFYLYAESFELVYVSGSSGGNDIANLYDSAGNDDFVAGPGSGQMSGNGFYIAVRSFDAVNAYALSGGYDSATLTGSAGNDLLTVRGTSRILAGSGFQVRADGFESARVFALTGQDHAEFEQLGSSDMLANRGNLARLTAAAAITEAYDFDTSLARDRAGNRVRANNQALDHVFGDIGG